MDVDALCPNVCPYDSLLFAYNPELKFQNDYLFEKI